MKELQFLLYNMPEGDGKVHVVIKGETLWCTQKAMAQLFGVGVPAISKHLNHIFEEGELEANTTVSKMEIVVSRGFRGEVKEYVDFYNLDAIIAVGYRVNSLKATRFRQWATKVLHEYIQKGIERENAFTMEQFAASVNEFLTFRRYALLPDKGQISREDADRKAEEEYRLFNPTQKIDSDFDKHIRGLFD